jgi:hypothetical protein
LNRKEINVLFLLIIFYPSLVYAKPIPEWKAKLSAVLASEGKIAQSQGNIEKAVEYYKKAVYLDPTNTEAKKLLSSKGKTSKIKKIVRMERKPLARKVYEVKPSEKTIVAEYKGISETETYPSWKRGPTVNTILDPYHPRHKDFDIPYFRDREGLKINKVIGIRGEYMYDKQFVGIESLLLEAQEFNQRSKDQLKDYISVNKKEYHREEIILNYKETWPTFTFINHEERTKREYEAKKLWSSNDVYYDNYKRKYYKIEYTIPRIRKIGFLKLKFRYGDQIGYRTNDPAAYTTFDSYLFGFETAPYSALYNGTFRIKFDFDYIKGKYPRAEEQGWSERRWRERNFSLELNFYNQRKYLRIKPHFYYEKERHYPSYNTWWTRKTGIKLEKELNGRLKYTGDWTYIKYTRDKDPFNSTSSSWPPNHVSCSAWTWENEMEYEIVRDLKLKIGFDYDNGLGFDGFDNYVVRTELQLRKPGLIDFRIGYRYANYFKIDEGEDTIFFKLGLFI